MFARGLRSAFTLLFGVFSFIILNPVNVQCTLCEARCEHAVPNLLRLKHLWLGNQKRVGGEDVSFRSFIKYLYIASQKYHRLNPLRDGIIAMVTEYRNCVKACEHQHSKRNGGNKHFWNQPTIQLPCTGSADC